MFGYYHQLSSEVYDKDKYIGRSFGDVEFYRDRLASCTGKILEPGVGNGRIMIPLLEKGWNVDGFDISPEMIRVCRANCEERGLTPKLFEGQMESFSLDTSYEAVIIPTGTFLLLHKREASMQALRNFYNHLSHGGKLIVDIFVSKEIPLDKVFTSTWDMGNGSVITLEKKIVEVDYINQYTVSHHRYEKWNSGSLVQTELERFPLRWYGVEEFKMMLEAAGFTNILLSADYSFGQEPTSSSSIITFEAEVEKR